MTQSYIKDIKKKGNKLILSKSYIDVKNYKSNIKNYLKAVVDYTYILNKNISCYNVMFRISRKEFNDFRIMYLNRLNKCQKSRVDVL